MAATATAAATAATRFSFTWTAIAARGRALALPFVATSASVGASMFVGDAVCQWIQYTAARTALLEAHVVALEDAKAKNLPPPPAPLVDELLRAVPRHPESRALALSDSMLAACPTWWNSNRSMAMLTTGCLAAGPWQFCLQRGAEAAFPGIAGGSIVKKLAVNMFTAPLGISASFYLINYLQNGNHDHAVDRVRSDLGRTYLTGFFFWPAVHTLNLRYVGVGMRPFVGSLAAAGWNIYISSQANKSSPPVAAEPLLEADASPPPATLELAPKA